MSDGIRSVIYVIYFCLLWVRSKAQRLSTWSLMLAVVETWCIRSKYVNNAIKYYYLYNLWPCCKVEFYLSNRFIHKDDAAIAGSGPEIAAAISLRHDPAVRGSARKLARSSRELRWTGAVYRSRLHNCGGLAYMCCDVLLATTTCHWSPR